jgi:hypothetical protein
MCEVVTGMMLRMLDAPVSEGEMVSNGTEEQEVKAIEENKRWHLMGKTASARHSGKRGTYWSITSGASRGTPIKEKLRSA